MELIKSPVLNSIWIKAAALGSLWASVEIVAGTFLHNLQIPFSGTILSFFTVFFLSSFAVIWKEKGIIWRAGVICALMKSISPSAIIIGPMIGITTEAIIFEWMLWLFGRNFFGFVMAGGIALFSALVHKILSLIILYGSDFVKILGSFYFFSVKQLKINGLDSLTVILIIIGAYLLIGFVAAALGYQTASRFLKQPVRNDVPLNLGKSHSAITNFNYQKSGSFSIPLILIHLGIIVLILFLINTEKILPAIVLSFGYLTIAALRYPRLFRKFYRISIWLQFAVIFMLACLLWDVASTDNSRSGQGWIAGLLMIQRAVIVIVGFTAISIELKNPVVKSVLDSNGLSNLYVSLNLSFSILPELISQFTATKRSVFNPAGIVTRFLANADHIVALFIEKQLKRPTIFVITGETGSGKSTFLQKILKTLNNEHIKISGIATEAIEINGVREGYAIVNLTDQMTYPFLSISDDSKLEKVGKFSINPDSLATGKKILANIDLKETQLIVIDELGPLELSNRGFAEAVARLCNISEIPQLWVVRQKLVRLMIRKWNIGDVYIFDNQNDSYNLAINNITRNLTSKN